MFQVIDGTDVENKAFYMGFFFKQAKHFQSDLSQGLVWGKRKVGYGISFYNFSSLWNDERDSCRP